MGTGQQRSGTITTSAPLESNGLAPWTLAPLTALLVSCLFATPAQSQAISGKVVNQKNDQPVSLASVALINQAGTVKKLAITDSEGDYSLTAPEPGIYALRVDAAGFNTLNGIQFRVRQGQNVSFDLRLWELTELAPVVVEAEREPFAPGPLAGFYERQKVGRGHFITREDIENQGSARFTDVLRLAPGVEIVALRSSYTVRMKNVARITGDCPPVLWVDNVKWGSIDLDGGPDRELFPSDLEGIEVYTPSQVPPEFSTTDSLCGVVAVWTRRGP